MITLDLKINDKIQKVQIKEDILFNAILAEHPKMIKKLIKTMCLSYKVSDAFFAIVNKFVDFNGDGISLYPGLIVRTGLDDYAVLYLEGAVIDEEYMLKLIHEYAYNDGDHKINEINVNYFEINKSDFLNAIKNN
jgi:hypothetical protein